MAALRHLIKSGKTRRFFFTSLKTLNPSSSILANAELRRPMTMDHRNLGNPVLSGAFEGASLKWSTEFRGIFFMMPAVVASLVGVGMTEMSLADADKADSQSQTPCPNSPLSEYVDMEKIVRQERYKLEDLLKSKGMQYGSYPPFTVGVKGQKIRIKFHLPPTCDIPHLIVDLASHLGLKAEEDSSGSDITLRAWDRQVNLDVSPYFLLPYASVAWQLELTQDKQLKNQSNRPVREDKGKDEGDLSVLIFQSLISVDNAEIEFIKQGAFSLKELDAVVSALKSASEKAGTRKALDGRTRGYKDRHENKQDGRVASTEKSIASLEAMGVRIFGLNEAQGFASGGDISWENIAGYDLQKRMFSVVISLLPFAVSCESLTCGRFLWLVVLLDTILLALRSPEVYDDIARGTRRKFETNRPRAVLFEGPPGTGKTSCARVIANQAGVPLLYVPLEIVMSKYYGESERLLGTVFSLANELSNGAIVFLDEVDSFAASRDEGIHEATRRILSVLLRQIDGFEQEKKVVVIAATNRKEDLDPALISRFDSMITFGLPDEQNRQEIVAQYAKHLAKSELAQLAVVTDEMSGRDIRDVCQQAERRWASKLIRGQAPIGVEGGRLPPLQEYIDCAVDRRKAILSIADKKTRNSSAGSRRSPMQFV
ncbi:hypothetical protein Syun_009890 [Stephania yunnanensis]|uniref:AAA+ ATPase domain-containing protein n=1 Tax=Stephania yunnanensis TaxID=152371 RepID=A0AAP0KFC1_9MAGN